MQLDQLELALRRRSPWEALDLGLVMLRHWCGPVYRMWCVTFVPFGLLVLALLWQWPIIATFIIWWLKPLFDRLLLKVFAEASFGAAPSVREVWRALPGLLRHSGLIAGLTLRRFNTRRSFELPVWQLEGQTGKAGRARLRVLSRKTSSYAFWLILVCTHIVLIFEFGLVGLVNMLMPSDGLPAFSWADLVSGESNDGYSHVFNLAWIAAESIVEPFFVAAGFSLYLNRRSELEGWDIEVAFQRMSEKHRQAVSTTKSALGRAAMIVLLAGSLSWTLVHPGKAGAEETSALPVTGQTVATLPEPTPNPAKRPGGIISKATASILADPVFGQQVEDLSWRLRQQKNKADQADKAYKGAWWVKYLLRIADLLARGTRSLIYVLVFLAIVALLVVMHRYRYLVLGLNLPAKKPLETLFGLNLCPASLPDDIAGAALTEVDSGRYAAALSLLYRGTLVALIQRQQIKFSAGDTEDICLHRVDGRIDAQAASYFAQLLDAWKRAAYAEMPPDAASVRDLCQRWALHFAGRGEPA
ncbi:DUF4129 domain-containing protein [Propionivibrio sp.]|uniref:DUF4129 domain-containing protein n=1 Tax=Propionivibrio sp. TaxID=2212460 RepID=UPI00261091CF|nr:DUF4129 domain-containing protein [Propionivibrio sp.]